MCHAARPQDGMFTLTPALCLPFDPFTPALCLPFDPFNSMLVSPSLSAFGGESKTHIMSVTALDCMLSSTLNPGGRGAGQRRRRTRAEHSISVLSPDYFSRAWTPGNCNSSIQVCRFLCSFPFSCVALSAAISVTSFGFKRIISQASQH